MQVTEKNKEGLKRSYTVSIPASDMEEKISSRLTQIAHTANMPGFRPGKVPASLLRKTHGQAIMGEVLEKTVSESSQQVLTEKELRPVSQPKIEIIKFDEGSDLEYSLELELFPEIELTDFSTLKLERMKVPADEKQVDEMINQMSAGQKDSKPVKKGRAVASGDVAVIDFTGSVDGEEFATSCCYQGQIRGASVSGADPNAPWFSLGGDTGLDSIYNEETGKYEYTDTNVIDGIEYTYAITAYDMGVSGARVDIGEFTDDTDTFYSLDTLYLANPDKWAEPDGYKSIENPRGTIAQDKNFVNVISGARATTNLNNVMVVPNPYVAHSEYNETEYLRKIRFNNLTPKCTIKIYTISGELVTTINHDSPDEGYAAWDLRSMNNQEVAPGLYIFTVQSDIVGVEDFIGKFAVIR